jgi:hypothetical protein
MNAWDHLPNAVHIDRVLASAKANPLEWALADDGSDDGWVWNQAWIQTQYDSARDQAWNQARDQAWNQVMYKVRGAILALIAYDDCAKYLNLPIDQLKMLYLLNEHPACLLLQPAVLVFAKEKELAQA